VRNADSDIACFIERMVRIGNGDRQRVAEDRRSLVKRYPVLFQI
jgi:hypothetical protein